jgi:hypothetical protein
MKVKGSRRLVKRLGLALAIAAIAAPAANARLYVEDYGTPVQARQYADDIRVAPQGRQYADDIRVMPTSPVVVERTGYAPVNVNARPDQIQPVSKVAVDDSTNFSWGDASIGAAVAFGLMLLGSGAILVGRHTRRSRLAAI